MDAATKTAVLNGMIRRMAAGGADITTDAWLEFCEAQNDGYRTGPEIGERVHDFTLTDQHGKNRALAELMVACSWSSFAAPTGDHTAATSSSSCNIR